MLSKRGQFIYYILVVGIALILLTISANLYLYQFTLRTVAISNLGNPNLNPQGWWIFTISFVFTGLALFPHNKYLYSRFQTKNFNTPVIRYIWVFLMITSCIGVIGVGIFNESMGAIHYVFAILGFGGMGLNMLYTFALLIYDIIKHRNWFHISSWGILYLLTFLALSVLIREFAINGISDPSKLNFSEWWSLFLLIGWFTGMYILLENENK